MIFLQIILIINTLVAKISCTIEFVLQKNSQLETKVNILKNTVNENQATIQVLNLEIEELKEILNETIDNTGIP
jgi:uncharacterized protein YoxC